MKTVLVGDGQQRLQARHWADPAPVSTTAAPPGGAVWLRHGRVNVSGAGETITVSRAMNGRCTFDGRARNLAIAGIDDRCVSFDYGLCLHSLERMAGREKMGYLKQHEAL